MYAYEDWVPDRVTRSWPETQPGAQAEEHQKYFKVTRKLLPILLSGDPEEIGQSTLRIEE